MEREARGEREKERERSHPFGFSLAFISLVAFLSLERRIPKNKKTYFNSPPPGANTSCSTLRCEWTLNNRLGLGKGGKSDGKCEKSGGCG